MNDRDTIVIMEEEYNVGDTDEKVKGLSIIIDGPLKMVLDKILCNNKQFTCYEDLLKEAIYLGLIEVINLELGIKENSTSVDIEPKCLDKTEYEEIPFEEFESLRNTAVESNIEYYD
ncbi:MAG: hypothetical protein ACRCTZ_08730 [Sarcina sp.]